MSDTEPLETSGLGDEDLPTEETDNDTSRDNLSEAIRIFSSQFAYVRVSEQGQRIIGDCIVHWKPSFLPYHLEYTFSFPDLGRGRVQYVSGQKLRVTNPSDYALEILPEIRSNLVKEIEATATLLEQLNKIMGTNDTEPWWIPIMDQKRWKNTIAQAHVIERDHVNIEGLNMRAAEIVADRINRNHVDGPLLNYLTTDGDGTTETDSTLEADPVQHTEPTSEAQSNVEAEFALKAHMQDANPMPTTEPTSGMQPEAEAKASSTPKAKASPIQTSTVFSSEAHSKIEAEAKSAPKAPTQDANSAQDAKSTQTAKPISEKKPEVDAKTNSVAEPLTQEENLVQTASLTSDASSDIEAIAKLAPKAPTQDANSVQDAKSTQTAKPISQTEPKVDAKTHRIVKSLKQKESHVQTTLLTSDASSSKEAIAKSTPKALTQNAKSTQTAKPISETGPKVEVKLNRASKSLTQEENPFQTTALTSEAQSKMETIAKSTSKVLTQDANSAQTANPISEAQPKVEPKPNRPPKSPKQEENPIQTSALTSEAKPSVEATAKPVPKVLAQKANPIQTPKPITKMQSTVQPAHSSKASAQETNLQRSTKHTPEMQSTTEVQTEPKVLAQEADPTQTAKSSSKMKPIVVAEPASNMPAHEPTLTRQERKNLRKRDKKQKKKDGAQKSTTDQLLQFAAEEHKEGVPKGVTLPLHGATNQVPIAHPTFPRAPRALGSGVMGLKWAYSTHTHADEALRKEGFWLFEKPQTYFHYQPYVYVDSDLGPEQAPVVVDTNGERFLEPDVEFDGKLLFVNAQDHPWPDIRSKPTHPDMLPAPKLAEYQACEAAGFTVWRHDRNLLDCRLLGCTKKTSDHDPRTVICFTCGPKTFIRYCSIEHQNADLREHWPECGRRELLIKRVVDHTTAPVHFGNLAPAIRDVEGDTSFPKYRQITFAARNYGRYTLFDWITGESTTLEWDSRYPRKGEMEARIERLLNASLFKSTNMVMVGLLYRTLRELLVLKNAWVMGTTFALAKQFEEEFGLDVWKVDKSRLCECEWIGKGLDEGLHTLGCNRLYRGYSLEYQISGMKGYVEMLEARYWILRAWRQQHPTVPHWVDRAAGDGFDGAIEGDEPVLGEGWEGWGAFAEDITL